MRRCGRFSWLLRKVVCPSAGPTLESTTDLISPLDTKNRRKLFGENVDTLIPVLDGGIKLLLKVLGKKKVLGSQ